MKAAVLREFGKPLSVEELPMLAPNQGEALVQVMASGLCMTDCHIQDGIISSVCLPFIPGHEMAGIVRAFGPDTEGNGVAVGDHVVCCIDITCGTCPLCQWKRENLCLNRIRIGFERNGSHAEYAVVPVKNLLPISSHVSFEQAAILPDAVACMYHAIKDSAKVQPGQWALIFGTGGLGLQGVQLLRHIGAKVIAAARTDAKLTLAEKLGADLTVNTRRKNLMEEVLAATHGLGCDAAFDLVGDGNLDLMMDCVHPGGKVVALAYGTPSFHGNFQELVIKEREIIGVRGSTMENLKEVIRLVEQGTIVPSVTDVFPLERINEALARLRESRGLSRSVIKMQE